MERGRSRRRVAFLGRVWRIIHKWHDKLGGAPEGEFSPAARSLRRKTHQTIKRVTHDIGERMNFQHRRGRHDGADQ